MVTVNNLNIVKSIFPNGEVQYITINDIIKNDLADPTQTFQYFVFRVVYENNSDLFNLLLFKKYLDDIMPKAITRLDMAFCPYGQADRDFPNVSFGTFKYFAKLINEAKFTTVIIVDPHSEVMSACLDHVEVFQSIEADYENYDLVFYPDNGAAKKYSEIINTTRYIVGHKKRDLETGKIDSYEILADKETVNGKKILIIDDLIVRGGTYKYAAQALKKMGANKIDLHITHVMPSAKDFWTKEYKDYGIDNVYTANTLNLPWANTPNVPKNNDNSKGFKDEVLNT